MSKIIVHIDGTDYGPYTLETARQYLAAGQLQANATARLENSSEWSTVGQLLAATQPPPPPRQQPVTPSPAYNEVATPTPTPSVPAANNDRTLMMIIYALFGIGLFTGGLFGLVAVITCYVNRSKFELSPVLGAHCRHLISTFWWTFGIALIGYILIITLLGAVIGLPLVIAVSIWYIYRLIKGFIAFNNNLAV